MCTQRRFCLCLSYICALREGSVCTKAIYVHSEKVLSVLKVYMCSHRFFLSKMSKAHVTSVRSGVIVIRVDLHVGDQSAVNSKPHPTHLTLVGFLSCVNPLVTNPNTMLSKRFTTHVTLVRFLSRVNSPVPFHISICCVIHIT